MLSAVDTVYIAQEPFGDSYTHLPGAETPAPYYTCGQPEIQTQARVTSRLGACCYIWQPEMALQESQRAPALAASHATCNSQSRLSKTDDYAHLLEGRPTLTGTPATPNPHASHCHFIVEHMKQRGWQCGRFCEPPLPS